MQTTRRFVAGLMVISLALCSSATRAQVCGRWVANPAPGVRPPLQNYSVSPTAPGIVDAAVAWDQDGDGPLPELLVCSGPFGFAGDQRVSGWAAFDGSTWRPFAPMPSGGAAHLLAADGSKLIAGVGLDLLRLDEGWTKIGTAVLLSGEIHPFRAVATVAGHIWVGGAFSAIDGQPAAGLAEWDGSAWHEVGAGLGPLACVQSILSRADGVYVGGYRKAAASLRTDAFVARWDGAMWHDLSVWWSSLSSVVNTLAESDGVILAGGSFGNRWYAPEGSVRQWDGQTWTTILSGLVDPAGAIVVDGDGVTVFSTGTGLGSIVNRKTNHDIAYRRAGERWLRLGDTSQGSARGVVAFGGRNIAYGDFTGSVNQGFAWWDGENWRNLGGGLGHPVTTLGLWDGRLVAAGNGVSVLEGETWRRLPSIDRAVSLRTVGTFAGSLYVSTESSRPSLYRWDGEEWTQIDAPLTYPSGYLSSRAVNCMREFEGALYVGGEMVGVGSTVSPGLVAWNGTAWKGAGDGLRTSSGTGSVTALTQFEGKLVVGGTFKRAGDVEVQNIAAWDGHEWSDMGGGVPTGGVTDFTVHNGELYAAATGWYVPWVWRWTGVRWQAVGAFGGATTASVRIRSFQGSLMAHVGSGWGLYVFDSTNWTRAQYLDIHQSKTMEVADGRLFCAGSETMPVDNGAWASFLAELQPEASLPVFGDYVAEQSLREGLELNLAIPVSGALPLTTKWFRDGTEIVISPSGFSNYQTSWHRPERYRGLPAGVLLTVRSTRKPDSGEYTVEVSNPCGTARSGPITVTVTCGADFNNDAEVNITDITDYLEAWFAGRSEANVDGRPYFRSVGDLLTFLTFYFEGCG